MSLHVKQQYLGNKRNSKDFNPGKKTGLHGFIKRGYLMFNSVPGVISTK